MVWDVFRPAKTHNFVPVWRFATAEDLVARAAEGPERLKTELRLYRQQLEQVGVVFFVLVDESRLKRMADDLKLVCKICEFCGFHEISNDFMNQSRSNSEDEIFKIHHRVANRWKFVEVIRSSSG